MKTLDKLFLSYCDSTEFRLVSCDAIDASDQQVQRIVDCCNEPAVYESLFTGLCGGQLYNLSHAKAWLNWARDGWEKGTHFAFAATDSRGLIVAACDIKSSDRQDAEIGYWRSDCGRGMMTDCVAWMLSHAVLCGFTSFHAYVKPENIRSAALLTRIGFHRDSGRDDATRFCYTRPAVKHLRDG